MAKKIAATKKILFLILALGLAGLIFPISNLLSKKASVVTIENEHGKNYSEVVKIFEQKCIDCHSSKTKFPFYANFPIAKQIITKDIEEGIEDFDMETRIFSNENPISEQSLAALEAVILGDSMPPFKYTALHWEAILSEKDKEVITTWIKEIRSENYAVNESVKDFAGEIISPIPAELELNHAKISLGEKLYHSKLLSGNDSVSCASCHDLAKGGTDQLKYSIGINDQEGHINAPTTLNSGFNFVQFWDGRAANLEEQAAGPVTNPIEMGASWDDVVNKLRRENGLQNEFNFIYTDGITAKNITDAIAEFERSLITPNSKFDKYLMGDAQALTKDEKRGYELFKKSGCVKCHFGVSLGGKSYERMNPKYFKDRGNLSKEDNGRFNVTNLDSDMHKFKVPTLRNIELTYPYLHDGSTSDLKEVVKTMGKYQARKNISNHDAELITKFLRTLTGNISK